MGFAEDITRRARWAIEHNKGIPNPAWSTGERLFVGPGARERAVPRRGSMARDGDPCGGWPGAGSYAEVDDWLARVRGTLEDDNG